MPNEEIFSAKKKPVVRPKDELAARVIVLEAMTMASLGVAMRVGRVTPENGIPVVDSVKNAVRFRLKQEKLSPGGTAEADRYLNHLLSNFSGWLFPGK